MDAIVECVPNISEGRDLAKIKRIVDSARNIPGCAVLGVEPDEDYNRTVITIAGSPESVLNAAYELILKAIKEIDMNHHQGEHPRLGAVDVCPFVPLQDVTMDDCVKMARTLAEKVAMNAQIPVYVYGEAAFEKEKTLLSTIRKGEYEGLISRLTSGPSVHSDLTRYPDFGPRDWNEKVARTGGITIGARGILVAYNVNIMELDAQVSKKIDIVCHKYSPSADGYTSGARGILVAYNVNIMELDAQVSKKIGSLIRNSGRLIKNKDGRKMMIPGMLPMVQGMGVTLESHSMSQVSMNLRDVEECPMHVALKPASPSHQTMGLRLMEVSW